MKIIFTISLILFAIVLISCQEDNLSANFRYEARVIGKNSDCGVYSIKILKDLSSVESIVGTTLDSIYIAKNLPHELEISGLEIELDLRKPKIYELSVCTDLGPSYNWLTVIRAKKK
jgi:ABC-type Zn uptake system ZnuABC Zn-binding protein ZnuA